MYRSRILVLYDRKSIVGLSDEIVKWVSLLPVGHLLIKIKSRTRPYLSNSFSNSYFVIRVFKSATLTRYPYLYFVTSIFVNSLWQTLKAGSYPSSCPKTDRLRDRDLEYDLDLERDLDRDDLDRDLDRLSDRLRERLRDLLPITKKLFWWKKIKIQNFVLRNFFFVTEALEF